MGAPPAPRATGLVPRQIDAAKFPACIVACAAKSACAPTPAMAMGTNCFCAQAVTQCISAACTPADKTAWTAQYPAVCGGTVSFGSAWTSTFTIPPGGPVTPKPPTSTAEPSSSATPSSASASRSATSSASSSKPSPSPSSSLPPSSSSSHPASSSASATSISDRSTAGHTGLGAIVAGIIAAVVVIAAILAFFIWRQRKAKQRDAYDMDLFKEQANAGSSVTPYSMNTPPYPPEQQQMQQAYPFANGYGPGSENYTAHGSFQQQQYAQEQYTPGVIATANGYVQAPMPVPAPVPVPMSGPGPSHTHNYSLGGSTYPQAGYPQQQAYAQPGSRQSIYAEGHSAGGPTYENSARITSMYDGASVPAVGGVTPFQGGIPAAGAAGAGAAAGGLAVAGIPKAHARPPTPTEIYVHERDGGRVGAPAPAPPQPVVNVMPPSYDPSWADDQSTSGTAGTGGRVVATPTRPEKSGLHLA